MKRPLSVPRLAKSLVLPIQLTSDDDYTVYLQSQVFEQALQNAWDPSDRDIVDSGQVVSSVRFLEGIILESNSWDWMGKVVGNGAAEASGRIHAVRCFDRGGYSVTLRELKPDKAPKVDTGTESPLPGVVVGTFGLRNDLEDKAKGKKFLAEQEAVGELSATAVFGRSATSNGSLRKGLILISGGTGSGKTTIMKGILQRALDIALSKLPSDRLRPRPHLVFIGDPIECFPYKLPSGSEPLKDIRNLLCESGIFSQKRRFDFTPRILGRDVMSVEQALVDALRETPEVFAISELRDGNDILAALRFAETGHLVIATVHSTSLQATFRRLIALSKAEQASDRASLVRQLHSIIHVQTVPPPVGSGFEALRLPTIWRGNSSGVRSFVSDGPTSLIPTRSRTPTAEEESAVLGKTWFIDQLIKHELDRTAKDPNGPLRLDQLQKLIPVAQHIDLESL
jgi:hypothetical protein